MIPCLEFLIWDSWFGIPGSGLLISNLYVGYMFTIWLVFVKFSFDIVLVLAWYIGLVVVWYVG